MPSEDWPSEDRRAIVDLLKPWKDGIFSASIDSKLSTTTTTTVLMKPVLPKKDISAAEKRQMMWGFRQAVELVSLAVAAHGQAMHDVTEAQILGFLCIDPVDRPARGRRALAVQTCVDCKVLCDLSMDQDLALCFTQQPPATEFPLFHAARDELRSRLVIHLDQFDRVQPMVVRIDVQYAPPFLGDRPLGLDTMISRLTRFAQDAHEVNQDPQATNERLPIKVNVHLHVREPSITSQLVTQIDRLARLGVSFDSEFVMLNPDNVTCDEDELTRLLALVTSGSTQFHASLAVRLLSSATTGDQHRAVLRAMTKFPDFDSDWIDGGTPWQPWKLLLEDLFDFALSRSLRLVTLYVLGRSRPGFEPMENTRLNDFVMQWKAANPHKRIGVKQLEVFGDVDGVLPVLAKALDHIESISLIATATDKIPSSVVANIPTRYRGLQSLQLTKAHVSTMDIFDESTLPALLSITLYSVLLNDLASYTRFFRGLLPQPNGRVRKLFKIEFRCDDMRLDEDEMVVVDKVLDANRVLQCMRLDYYKKLTNPSYLQVQTRLLQHNGDIVFMPPSEHVAGQVAAQRVAFLSVIAAGNDVTHGARSLMDARTVQQIFQWSAPHARRHVSLNIHSFFLQGLKTD